MKTYFAQTNALTLISLTKFISQGLRFISYNDIKMIKVLYSNNDTDVNLIPFCQTLSDHKIFVIM